MQLWQQQLLSKKFQEERRQQQLRQLDHEKRQLIPHSQLSVLGKPATGDRLPATSNDMPINDAHNYMWPNNFVGDVSNLPINSQMFIPSNMNLAHSSYPTALQNFANGSFMLNDHNPMLSMGLTLQQNDQFIHGMPVSCTGTVEQYPQFFGISSNFNNLVAGPNATLSVKSSYPFTTTNDQQSGDQSCSQDKILFLQNLQGRNMFGSPPMQVLGNDVTAGNFLEASNPQFDDQLRDFHSRQEQDDTSGNLHGKQVSDIGNCRDAAGLDPMEQKLLFGTDEDDNWGSLAGCLTSGIGGDLHGHSLEIDHYGTLPSIHSGSWSALMQEAVQASTSDKGVQEEWSGLSSQNAEPGRMPLCVTNDNGKQPTLWIGNNLKNQVSLTAQPFSLLSDPNATPSSSIVSNKSLLLKSAHEENNMPLMDTSHVPLMSSLRGINGNEFPNSQNHTKPVEGDVNAETRTGQIFEQCQNRSRNTQSKSQDNGSGWTGHKNLHLSNAPIQPVNNLGGRSASHAMASRGDSTSDYHEIHGNHVNLSAGTQTVKSDITSPKMQSGDYLAGNLGSVGNPNPLKLNQNMPQQITNEQKSVFGRKFAPNARGNSGVDKDAAENQTQPNPKLQSWEWSRIPSAERLGHIVEKEKDSMAALSGKGYVGDALKDIVTSGGLNTVQHGQLTVGPNMVHNSLANLKNNAEPTSEFNHQLNMQGFSNSIFNRSNIDESFSGRSSFVGHAVCNNPMNATEKIVVEAEYLSKHARSASSSSSFFNGSTAQYAQNETISQASNMLELLHKVDRSGDVNTVNAPNRSAQVADDVPAAQPHADLSSNSRGFGLQLAPPSSQLLSIKSPISHNLLNDPMIAQSSHQGQASYQDQAQTNYSSLGRPLALLHEASETQNWDKISNPPGHQQNKHMEANKYLNSSSAAAPDFPLVQKQLQEQQLGLQRQDHSGAKYHLEQHQELQIPNKGQANVGTPAKSSLLVKQTHDSNDGAVASQSVQTSLPTLPSGFFTSGVASRAENHGSGSSQFFSGRGDPTKPTVTGFSQIQSPGHQLPASDTKSVSHSTASGMSQQDGISKMLHNVWTNISVQQRQAGVNPLLTPNVLQSLINHGRERSSWGMPKTAGQVNKEEGAPDVGNSSNSKQDENPAQVRSSNLLAEPMDVSNAKHMFQGEEAVPMPAFGRGSSFPASSLVHLHQHNINKGNHEQGRAVNSKDLHSPITTDISSSSVISILGGLPKFSDHQLQNYSLLHQMQTMKASDSDINNLAGNMLSGVPFGSNTPQMNLNVNQKFDHEQNTNSKYPDIKVGAPSQVSLSSDAKMLSFAANDNEEKNPTTSSAGRGILQTLMHPLSTSSMATALGGTECTQIRPHIASWVEHNATYQNGRMGPLYDAQRSGKASVHQYAQDVPARMEDSAVIDQRFESAQAGDYEQGILSTKILPNESSPLLLPNTIDQSTILRHKKRKSVTADLPWHKIVTECPQSWENTSMADLEWNFVANRLMEKVDDDAEALEDDPLIHHSRRRLIVPTQLMHQLVPAVPSALLKEEAALAYESGSFVIAKSALADACGLVSYIKNDSHEPVENENMTVDDIKTSKMGNGAYSNLAENFISRSEKLEADFSRLETGPSLLEMQMECQELERFSIVNQLGKFHGRTHADAVEVSATGAVHPRTFAQRQINAVSMSGNLPEGIVSLPL